MSGAWPLLDVATHPPAWDMRRIGDVADLTNGYPFDSEAFGTEGMPLVRIRDLYLDEYATYVRGAVPDAVVLKDGDVVIGMDGDFDVAIWKRGPAALNQRMCLLRGRDRTDSRFLAYVLPRHLRVINDLTYATTVKHLSSFDVLAERVALPPPAVQRAIADYLDAETKRIDRVVDSMRRVLELADERRGALLGEVMTGRHPISAEALQTARPRKLSTIAAVDLGRARSPDNAAGRNMTPYLRAANVKDGRLALDTILEMNFSPREQQRYALQAGDIMVTEGAGSLAAVGVSAVWGGELSGVVCFQNHLLRVRARPSTNPQYLAWWMRFAYESGLLASLASGAQILNLGSEEVRNLAVRLPPPTEQASIAEFLAVEIGRLDLLRTSVQRQIDLLGERRQALITAAVTGQLVIPGVAA